MNPTLLLAGNFVRQNRWILVAFAFWPFLLGTLVWSPHHRASIEDVLAIVQQEIFYGLAISGFLSSSALYNEKRSRRIVGVLSKAVGRGEYLLALLLGTSCFGVLYFLAVSLSVVWLLGSSTALTQHLWMLLACGTGATVWIGALALLFSTFLHPFVAAALTGIIAFAPLAAVPSSHMRPWLLPVLPLLDFMQSFQSLAPNWEAVAASWLQASAFLMLATLTFKACDVTVSIE